MPAADTPWSTDVRPDSAVLTFDAPLLFSGSSARDAPFADSPLPKGRVRAKSVSATVGLQKELDALASVPVLVSARAPATSSNTKTILSDLEICHATSTSASISGYHELSTNEDSQKEISDHNNSTSVTTRQYGIGRQVVRGSGRGLGDLGGSLKRNSKRSSKWENEMEREEEHRSSVSEPVSQEVEDGDVKDGEVSLGFVETGGNNNMRLDLDSEVNQDPTTPTSIVTPTPTRRRVNSDDTNPNIVSPSPSPNRPTTTGTGSKRTHCEKFRERVSPPEWTLFLGVPRNAPPPVPVINSGLDALSIPLTVEPIPIHAAVPKLAATPLLSTLVPPAVPPHPRTTERSQNERKHHSFIPSHIPPMMTTMTRIRTKSDSALLTTAAATSGDTNTDTEQGISSTQDNGKAKTKTTLMGGGEDWTLSLPLMPSAMPSRPVSSFSPSALRKSGNGERGWGSKYLDVSSMMSGIGSMQAVMKTAVTGAVDECEQVVDVRVEGGKSGLVITVEDVDRQQTVGRSEREDEEKREEEEDQDSLILRVPRIVRSCSSIPLLATTNCHSQIKKASDRWMAAATSTPNLRARVTGVEAVERLSSATLEEEVMCMLLGDNNANSSSDNSGLSEDDEKRKSRSRKKDQVVLAKKMATLDEDLARFNALLKNGGNGRLSSALIETATAMKKAKVTLNETPITTPTSTPSKSSIASSSQTQPILKPVLKHAKSCDPFLESHSNGTGIVHSTLPVFPPPPPSTTPPMCPVMRFPSSAGKGVLSFFDELGGGFKPSKAGLRSSRSAEWKGESHLPSTTTTLPSATTSSISTSSRTSSSPPPSQCTTRKSTSSISSPNLTSSTQTLLLPFASASTSTSTSSNSHNAKYTTPSAFNLKSKSVTALGSSGAGVENAAGASTRKGVPMLLRTSSRAVSMGSLRNSTAPIESNSGKYFYYPLVHEICILIFSHYLGDANLRRAPKGKLRQKPGTPPLRVHTSSSSSSSSSSSRLCMSNNRRSITPPPPPSPIASESSSALPTPLASSFPLPPCSLGMSEIGDVEAFEQKLREFEFAREKYLQQEQQREVENQYDQQPESEEQRGNQYRRYRPSTGSSVSSVSSLVSNASSTATVVPSGDQKSRMRSGRSSRQLGVRAQEAWEDDEDSMCSGTYYSARSSFSSEGV